MNQYKRVSYLYNLEKSEISVPNGTTGLISGQSADANQIVKSDGYNCDFNPPIIFKNQIYCYFWKSNSERELSSYNLQNTYWSQIMNRNQ